MSRCFVKVGERRLGFLVLSTLTNDVSDTNEYILPDSDIRRLSKSEIEYLTFEELSLARNEIYARHDHIFKKGSLQIYFDRKSWYNQDPYYDDTKSSIEKYNVNLIKSREEFLK
ncbi:YARHG domain-containing protein [Neobacillus drentensis]|uniref:YARHG domain-containing protein n=1 Tax=Neobacillus drentensis TaxID=220684 RepID=UPI003001EBFC